MSKSEFVDKVAAESGLSKKDAGAAVDAVLRTIEQELKGGGEVSFTGFGKFHVADRGAREGRNPRTGETMQIAATKVPRFSAGSGLKQGLQQLDAAPPAARGGARRPPRAAPGPAGPQGGPSGGPRRPGPGSGPAPVPSLSVTHFGDRL